MSASYLANSADQAVQLARQGDQVEALDVLIITEPDGSSRTE
jgi:hypothetical protein